MTDEAIDVGRLLRRVGGNPRVFEQVVRLTIDWLLRHVEVRAGH